MIPLLISIGCLGYLTAFTLLAINKMDRHTCMYIRFSFVSLAIGSFAWLCSVVEGDRPSVSEMLFIGSVTVFFHATRRKEQCFKTKEV